MTRKSMRGYLLLFYHLWFRDFIKKEGPCWESGMSGGPHHALWGLRPINGDTRPRSPCWCRKTRDDQVLLWAVTSEDWGLRTEESQLSSLSLFPLRISYFASVRVRRFLVVEYFNKTAPFGFLITRVPSFHSIHLLNMPAPYTQSISSYHLSNVLKTVPEN